MSYIRLSTVSKIRGDIEKGCLTKNSDLDESSIQCLFRLNGTGMMLSDYFGKWLLFHLLSNNKYIKL